SIVKVFVREFDGGLWTNDQRSCGVNAIALEVDTIPEAAGVFVKTVQAKGYLVAKRLIPVAAETFVSKGAALKSYLAQGSEPGFFTDAINHATAAATTEQHRVWSFQCFDTFDVVEVAVILHVVAHAIQKEVGAGVVATNDELIAIVLALVRCYSGNISHHIGHAGHRLIPNLFPGYDGNRLWNVA